MQHRFRNAATAACCVIIGFSVGFAAPAARAAPAMTWLLVDTTFSDGGTATGWIGINVAGYLDGFDIAVTAGSLLPQYDYSSNTSPAPSFPPGATILDLSAATGPGYLQLAFSFPLNTFPSGGINPIVVGASSYECTGWENPGSINTCNGTQRLITAGDATVPEPASLPLIATALAGVLAVRRRRPA